MKELLDKIKEKYGKNWLEILFMAVFAVAALALNASEIAAETAAVFGRSVNKPEQGAVQEVSEEAAESEGGTESEEAAGSAGSTESEETAGSAGSTEPEETAGSVGSTEPEETAGNESSTESEETSDDAQEGSTEIGGTGAGSAGGTESAGTSTGSTGSANSGTISDAGADSAQPGALPDGQTPGYEIFTLQDTKRIRDFYPVYLPGVTGPVEYWKVWEDPDLAEYQTAEYQSTDRTLTLLRKMIGNRLAGYDGDWSVYVKNLDTDESIVINDRPMKSASVMKLFIMGAVYRAIDAGELERTDEVVSLLNNMITVSDNESSNQLLYLLGDESYEDGIAKVDEFIQEYGFSEMTVEYNGFNNSATITDSDNFNQVSAKDCGKLLEDIYRRTWVNRSVGNEIEGMLLDQHTRYKIPAGLPESVLCGNKTGEMDTTENDAAIIYAEDCDYILVVLSSDWSSKDEAVSRIASLSGMVYEFLNE